MNRPLADIAAELSYAAREFTDLKVQQDAVEEQLRGVTEQVVAARQRVKALRDELQALDVVQQ